MKRNILTLEEELKRFSQINDYVSKKPINEQLDDVFGDDEDDSETATDDLGDGEGEDVIPEPIDVETDDQVSIGDPEQGDSNIETDDTELGDTEIDDFESESEEIDITDLVSKQKSILDKQDEFRDIFKEKLEFLTSKLEKMDTIFAKIDTLDAKVSSMREKRPEEKLQLRSLDSFPYNQKLTDYFDDKFTQMKATDKNEYVLTDEDVENYNEDGVKNSFTKLVRET